MQTVQEKPSTEKKGVVEKPPAPVEKKPSTDAKAATRQPAYATAMNGHLPPGLTGTPGDHLAKPIATHPEAIHEAATELPEAQEIAETIPSPVVTAVPPHPATGPAGPHAKPKVVDPKSDPRFQHVITRLNKSAAKTKKHPPAAKKAAEAHAAAEPPKNEKMAGAKANQVQAMQQADTKKPDQESFLSLLLATIDRNIPKTVGDTQTFMKGEEKQTLKNAMTGTVNKEKAEATGELKATAKQEPDPKGVEGKQVTPLPAEKSSAPPAIGAADAVPAPKDASEISQQHSKQEADDKLKEAQVTPEQLKEANDPRFSAVITAKSAVDKQADTAPQKYREDEHKVLTQETAKAVADEKHGLTALQDTRDKSGAAVKTNQLTAKQQDEARQKEVTDHIENIYNETKQAVENKLGSLESDVTAEFDKGVEDAMAKMKNYVDQRLDERYSGFGGLLSWVGDKLGPVPPEVKEFYQQGREVFRNELHLVIVRIANIVDVRLKEAKDEIAKGQQRIREYVQSRPKDLQTVAQAAEKAIAGRFDELRQSVDDKKNDLAQKLAQRYKEACDKADEELKKMEEENKGLLAKLADKIAEVAKILGEFRDRITNMLKAGRDTILLIVAHPINFLKNVINAIKLGVSQFVDNIWTHLKAGFISWLFGTLENAGIQIPKDFSLGSILKLVLQILGITYAKMRAKFVKLIGERNVMIIEKVAQVIYTLITGGPEALWEQIKEFLGNLKEMVVDAIQNWVISTVIKAAVIKLLSLFNPVGAIIQAIMGIYNTVMFFIERINQILDFVESIINSVHKIAVGDIGDAANWIEKALGRTVPLIISFLARLLGLGGISEEIQKIIKKIQDFVDKAIDYLIEKVVKWVKSLFGKGKEEKPDERTPEQKEQDLDKGMAEAEKLLEDEETSSEQVKKKLPGIKSKYRLASLELLTDSESDAEETDHIHGENSPGKDSQKKTKQKTKMDPPFAVDPFECDTNEYNIGEYRKQVKMQEKGLNVMSIVEWLNNRYTFLAEGRSPEGRVVIEIFRAVLPQKETKGKAGLHRVDQVAGGDPMDIAGFGNTRINSSIGSQWKTRVIPLHQDVEALIEKVNPNKAAKIRMNVKLSVVEK